MLLLWSPKDLILACFVELLIWIQWHSVVLSLFALFALLYVLRLMTRRWIRPSLVVPSNTANETPRKAPPIKMPREHMNNCITEQLLGRDGFSWIFTSNSDHKIKSFTFSRKCNFFSCQAQALTKLNWSEQVMRCRKDSLFGHNLRSGFTLISSTVSFIDLHQRAMCPFSFNNLHS